MDAHPTPDRDAFRHLRVARDGFVLRVTLDRPERLNAVNARMAGELRTLLQDADHDAAVRCVVLTGAGRGFCAGADLQDIAGAAGHGDIAGAAGHGDIAGAAGHGDIAGAAAGTEGAELGPAGLRQVFRRDSVRLAAALLDFEKPLVAAVNGPCAGAGLGIALACDVVVASAAASFSAVFVRRGLVPDYATTYLLPRLVGLRVARELCLLGDGVDAERAAQLGLVTAVVPPEDLAAAADGYAQRFVEGAGVAIRLTKRLLSGAFEVDAATALDREFTAQALCFASDDAREGAASFLEKRPARFAWR